MAVGGEFGVALARERQRRRWSQQRLADVAGISQRHLSFLETGRSQPGRAALSKLLNALDLDIATARRLMAAAGFRPGSAPVDWDDAAFAPARHGIRLVLDRHEPFPALVIDRAGSVLSATTGLERLLAVAGLRDVWERTSPSTGPNLYDLTLHPDGIIQALVNPHEVVPHTLRRLVALAASSDAAQATLDRVVAYPAVRRHASDPYRLLEGSSAVVTEDYEVDGRRIRLVAMTASLGRPEEALAQEVSIELLYPADVASEHTLEALLV